MTIQTCCNCNILYIVLAAFKKAGFKEYLLTITHHHHHQGVQEMLLTSSTETGNTTRLMENKGEGGAGNGERNK